jgi:regulatory protein
VTAAAFPSGTVKRRTPQSADDWFQGAIRYLSRVDRTAAQVERFLASKGASSAHVKQVVSRLSALRYLDDRAYAVRWLESTLVRRPMARDRLRNELRAKGLAESLVDDTILEGLREMDDDALARRALALKARNARRLSLQRMALLLRQRGFGEETIERIISDCSGKE